MAQTVISVEDVSKRYDLGSVGTGTLRGDLRRWWANLRGRPDPDEDLPVPSDSREAHGLFWALKGVSFSVERGEAVGIIGRNGAGKSTLLKILSRITAPTCGVVRARGRIAALLEVGTGFHPDLTGRENIFLNGTILGMRREEIARKRDAIIDFSGVGRFIDVPVKRYSSGMYVRLAFSVAAHLEPDILILDEVLSVGDLDFRRKCLTKMREASRAGRTILFVSHDLAAISERCDRCLLLDEGMVREYSKDVSAVIERYVSTGPR